MHAIEKAFNGRMKIRQRGLERADLGADVFRAGFFEFTNCSLRLGYCICQSRLAVDVEKDLTAHTENAHHRQLCIELQKEGSHGRIRVGLSLAE